MPTFIQILSPERFATYSAWAGGNPDLARRLYTYNVQLSAALYGPLHMLEISLRNVTDQRLTAAFGAGWLTDPAVVTGFGQVKRVQSAQTQLTTQRKAGTHGQMVAELSFGFWSSLYSRQSHHLWNTLRPGFQATGVQRGSLSRDLDNLRNLRNRIAHYEPIISSPLAQLYGNLTTIAGWLSPTGASWIAASSTWSTVYPGIPILVPDPATGQLKLDTNAIAHLPA